MSTIGELFVSPFRCQIGEGSERWRSDAQEAAKWCGLGLLSRIQVIDKTRGGTFDYIVQVLYRGGAGEVCWRSAGGGNVVRAGATLDYSGS
jgi:hypothetical protein